MQDTAYVMEKLYKNWLPDAAARFFPAEWCGNTLENVCVFLTLAHDIGKLTPVFVSKLLPMLPDAVLYGKSGLIVP